MALPTRRASGVSYIPPGMTQTEFDNAIGGARRPSASSIAISEVIDLQTNLDGKAAISHTHTALQVGYVAKTSTYTASASDCVINCTSGTFTVNLPTAVGIAGRQYIIKNSGAGTITADPNGSETLDGAATASITAGNVLRIVSDGANWIIT